MTDSVKTSHTPPIGWWSSRVDAKLASALKVYDVCLEPIDPAAVRLGAVPLPNHFSKRRTNLLVHRASGQLCAYVDFDLDYSGPNHAVRAALHGPVDRNWRQLSMNIPDGNVSNVVRATLEALGSPVMDILRADLDEMKQPAPVDGPFDPNSILATQTRAVAADELVAAFRSSVHKPLAQRMAVALTRQAPCGCVVWAPSGSGKGHLVRTAAHILLRCDDVSHVRHLSGARLTCNHMSPAERDRILAALLDELTDRPLLLLLVDHLDLSISGTMGSLSVLAEALGHGARLLATIQSEDFLRHIQAFPFLARRLLPIKVPSLSPNVTLKTLRHVARASGYDVSPTALTAAVEITERQEGAQPAAAIDLLHSAMAEAHWRSQKTVTPDDITSVLRPDWPQ